MSEPAYYPTIALADITVNSAKAVHINGTEILLCNDDGTIFAIAPRCSHADEPLVCGRVRWGWIACPAHGAKFDLETGEAITGPASEPIKTFAVRISGEMIEVAL
jgi:3-phenylpropionate/trans-cinnamate dioxygenase ferredoxin component